MIREARANDLEGINHLLYQVNNVHADGRPDLFQHGSKKYNDETRFESLNYDFKEHGFYTILGESGCGKSTLLNIISLIEMEK